MLVNRLYVVPNESTMSYLSSLLSGSPVDLDLSTIKVEIMTTQDALEIDPDREYRTQAINVNVFYDTQLQRSNLMVTLTSHDLQERAKELNREGVVREFYDWYIPYFCLVKGMPPLSRHYRTWKVSIANALCSNERPLVFGGEYVEQDNVTAYPDYDYMNAMAADLHLRHGSPM